MAFWIAQMTMLSTVSNGQDLRGGIRGVVYDAEFSGPVPQATVRLLEAAREQTTANDGHFAIGDLPPGVYTVVVSKPGFIRQMQTGVAVVAGAMADVTLMLRGEVMEMEEFVVRDLDLEDTATEAGLLNLRAASLTFQDSISRDVMSKAGASDVAGALRLVVGASVVDGKYASVRGLSDRYVGAAVNGIRVPSSDPKKRAVQLDVFPAGTVESITVSKTFTPDLPGDYTGGGINIRTVGLPSEPFFKAGFSREINRRTTGKEGFVTYDGAGINRWGRHRGARDMPEGAASMEADQLTDKGLASRHDQLAPRPRTDSPAHTAYDRLVRSFAPAMGVRRNRVPDGNHGYDISMGGRQNLGGAWDLGAVAALAYSKKFTLIQAEETELNKPPATNPADEVRMRHRRDIGTEELKWSEVLSVGLARDDAHVLQATALRNRAVTDRASYRENEHTDEDELWGIAQGIHYQERSIDILQFRGEHRWDRASDGARSFELDWFFARNRAEQEEPDVRSFKNVVQRRDNGVLEHQARPDGSSGADEDSSTRIWRNTLEQNSIYGLNVGFPLRWKVPDWDVQFMGFGPDEGAWSEETLWLRLGFVRDWTRRTYRQNSFYYTFASQAQPLYTGPVRSDFPPGSAGRKAYEAARAAWFASPAGQQYTQAQDDAAADSAKRTFRTTSPDALWTDVFTQPDRIGLGPYTDSMYWYILPKLRDVSYDGLQVFRSGYWMLQAPVVKQIQLIAGARLETTQLSVVPTSDVEDRMPDQAFVVPVRNFITNANGTVSYYYTLDGVPKAEAIASIEDTSWLRSLGLVYQMAPGMNLRLNWSQTIARPTFLEIAPVITYDFIEGESFIGNRDLKLSRIVNRDLRWEWFPTEDEVLAVSVFSKDLRDPIERETFGYLSQDYILAVNYPSGRVSGYEIEGRTRLDFLPDPFKPLRIGVNYTKIDASVEIPEAVAEALEFHGIGRTKRPMEGQPEYLFNFNLTYDIEPWGTSFGWFYNIRGDMLKAGAAIGDRGATPDIFVKKFANATLSLSQKIGPHAKVTLRAHNILDLPVTEVYREPDGTETIRRRYREGVRYSIGVSAEW